MAARAAPPPNRKSKRRRGGGAVGADGGGVVGQPAPAGAKRGRVAARKKANKLKPRGASRGSSRRGPSREAVGPLLRPAVRSAEDARRIAKVVRRTDALRLCWECAALVKEGAPTDPWGELWTDAQRAMLARVADHVRELAARAVSRWRANASAARAAHDACEPLRLALKVQLLALLRCASRRAPADDEEARRRRCVMEFRDEVCAPVRGPGDLVAAASRALARAPGHDGVGARAAARVVADMKYYKAVVRATLCLLRMRRFEAARLTAEQRSRACAALVTSVNKCIVSRGFWRGDWEAHDTAGSAEGVTGCVEAVVPERVHVPYLCDTVDLLGYHRLMRRTRPLLDGSEADVMAQYEKLLAGGDGTGLHALACTHAIADMYARGAAAQRQRWRKEEKERWDMCKKSREQGVWMGYKPRSYGAWLHEQRVPAARGPDSGENKSTDGVVESASSGRVHFDTASTSIGNKRGVSAGVAMLALVGATASLLAAFAASA